MGDSSLLPFLVYHDVLAQPRSLYDIGMEEFKGHLELIGRGGWSTISIGEFLDWQRYGATLSPKSLVLTFDDGYAAHGDTVLPLLAERGMSAVFFISAGLVGREGYLSMSDVERMGKMGMEIGSHGLSHRPLPLMSDDELRRELSLSRSILREGTGHPVDLLSAPRGVCSRRVREFAARAGYRAVCTSKIAYNRRSSDPLDLGRIWIRGGGDIEAVVRGRRGRFALQRLLQAGREMAKAAMGYELYNWLRRRLLGDRAEKE